jgi:hypothetical protein
MISRIAQRTEDDCTICVIAMVMGPPYNYDRVQADSQKYPKLGSDGRFHAWWELYLREEQFEYIRVASPQLPLLSTMNGRAVGIVSMDIPALRQSHVVAIDELGIVDPADNAPDHVELFEYMAHREAQGCVFHDEFLAVRARENLVG